MSVTLTSAINQATGIFGENGLMKKLEKDGRMPPINLIIKPLGGSYDATNPLNSIKAIAGANDIAIQSFLSYNFSSSIIIPVDTFSFSFVTPDGPSLDDQVKCGDIVTLEGNGKTIATGIVDITEVETEAIFGEKSTISGRDLLGQLEDQDAISLTNKPIWLNSTSIRNGVLSIIENTRIKKVVERDSPGGSFLLASDAGESKLSTLQRFLDPLNCIAWMGANGELIVGKPNFKQPASGRIVLSKKDRISNVLSMRVTRASTSIPNIVQPIWTGQELTVDRMPERQAIHNMAPDPSRLYKSGHKVPKTVVISNPKADDRISATVLDSSLRASGGDFLGYAALREIARANINEIIVQAVVPGHFNEDGEPYAIDTCYDVHYDRGNVSEKMYLYQVEYQMSEDRGQITNLYFCRTGCIVAGVRSI